MPVSSKTSYSIAQGGEAGYINIGGWNSTLTDVNTNPAEVCGLIRQEGANKYIYAMQGSQSAARGAFVTVCTALTDDASTPHVAPLRLTAAATGCNTAAGRVFGMVVATTIGTNQYGWFLRQGITTAYAVSNTGFNIAGGYILPSVLSANFFSNATTNTAVGYVLDPCASATAACGSAGALVYVNFESLIGSP
jgi:hypothetical protein